jgi:hypothetical protein
VRSQEERNETVQYLLEEVFLADLSELEAGLCGHNDTEKGFYCGALAAIKWMRKGMGSLVPGDPVDVALRLGKFINEMNGDTPDEA